MRGLADLRSSILQLSDILACAINRDMETHIEVLMLSKGVTASSDSVIPAPKPAITVLGPDILPASSWSRDL